MNRTVSRFRFGVAWLLIFLACVWLGLMILVVPGIGVPPLFIWLTGLLLLMFMTVVMSFFGIKAWWITVLRVLLALAVAAAIGFLIYSGTCDERDTVCYGTALGMILWAIGAFFAVALVLDVVTIRHYWKLKKEDGKKKRKTQKKAKA